MKFTKAPLFLVDPVFREAEVRIREKGSDFWLVKRWESMAFEAVR